MYLNKIKILHEHEFKFTLILSTTPSSLKKLLEKKGKLLNMSMYASVLDILP